MSRYETIFASPSAMVILLRRQERSSRFSRIDPSRTLRTDINFTIGTLFLMDLPGKRKRPGFFIIMRNLPRGKTFYILAERSRPESVPKTEYLPINHRRLSHIIRHTTFFPPIREDRVRYRVHPSRSLMVADFYFHKRSNGTK